MLHSILERQIRGPTSIRRTIPTEVHSRFQLYKRLMGHLSPVYCVCFDQTGQYIFTGADDHLIKIWSAKDGRLLKSLRGHDGPITDMSVNYENRLLASGSVDRVIRIWDLKTSKLLDCLNSHHGTVTTVKFAPYNRHGKDRYLISTSNDGCVIFWKYEVDSFKFTRLKKFQERNRPGGKMACSSFSSGGSFLACGSSDSFVHVYGFHPNIGPYWLNELVLHEDKVDSIQFSNQGFRFVTGSQDGTAAVWSYRNNEWTPIRLHMSFEVEDDLNNFSSRAQPGRKKNKVMIVQWSRDDRYVMTSVADNSIKVWNSHTGMLVHVLREHSKEVYLIESHPTDPRIFTSASHDGTMIIWDIERAKIITKFTTRIETLEMDGGFANPAIYDMKFSPDGNMIATTDSHGYLSVYGNGNGNTFKELPEQMFFHTDYRALIRDLRGFVMDEQTHIAPHLMPRPTLVDMNGNPHPASLQRFVPDRNVVVTPLTDDQVGRIALMIASHSLLEDEEYLAEKRVEVPPGYDSTSDQAHSSNLMNEESESSRYYTRASTRYSFRSARNNFMTGSRRNRPRIRYFYDEDEDVDDDDDHNYDATHVNNDTETETDIDSDDETVINESDSTEIMSDATEVMDADSDTTEVMSDTTEIMDPQEINMQMQQLQSIQEHQARYERPQRERRPVRREYSPPPNFHRRGHTARRGGSSRGGRARMSMSFQAHLQHQANISHLRPRRHRRRAAPYNANYQSKRRSGRIRARKRSSRVVYY